MSKNIIKVFNDHKGLRSYTDYTKTKMFLIAEYDQERVMPTFVKFPLKTPWEAFKPRK